MVAVLVQPVAHLAGNLAVHTWPAQDGRRAHLHRAGACHHVLDGVQAVADAADAEDRLVGYLGDVIDAAQAQRLKAAPDSQP